MLAAGARLEFLRQEDGSTEDRNQRTEETFNAAWHALQHRSRYAYHNPDDHCTLERFHDFLTHVKDTDRVYVFPQGRLDVSDEDEVPSESACMISKEVNKQGN